MGNQPIPNIGSQWQYGSSQSKRIYTVILIANEHFDTPAYPITVIYLGRNGRIWAKNITVFLKTMRKFKESKE